MMRRQPLRVRILRALELSPMTIGDLSRALSCHYGSVQREVSALRRRWRVSAVGTVLRCHRPNLVFGLRAHYRRVVLSP
jgi:hypothetical protein